MDILLTESQYIRILKEQNENKIAGVFQDSKSFTKNLLSNVKKQFGIDFTFLGTWGSVIGGFVGPISDYLHGRYVNLSDSDITLISFGILLTFFSDNKEKLRKVLDLIKERGIITFFDRALMKSYDLKESFFSFLESLNVSFPKLGNMISYTFLVPLVPLIFNLSNLDLGKDQIELIIKGISLYVGGILSTSIIESIISKMIKRFKNSDNNQ